MSSNYVNPRVIEAQYAVRGLIPTRATQIQQEMKQGKKFPFKQMIFSNIGNPQALKQKPLTFHRQVMSLVDYPQLLDNPTVVDQYPADAVARARKILKAIDYKTGAYTHSQGYQFAREDVAKFLDERDRKNSPSVPTANVNDIYLTDGASNGVKVVLQTLVGAATDAVMIPIPQYPLYTASIALLGGSAAKYYLDESQGWAMTVANLEESYSKSVAEGKTPRVLVVINPGNPTGQVLDREIMEGVVRFAHSKKLVLMADEVYQENIYSAGKSFNSFRQVVLSSPAPYNKETMLVSLHSTSKGIIGECGRRGGFMDLVNIPEPLVVQINKLASINLCSNVNGQVMTALMVQPPKPGDASFALYRAEFDGMFASLVRRAKHLVTELNTIKGFTCNPTEGAMYAYPSLMLPAGFIKWNEQENARKGTKLPPDTRYCLLLLEATGIVVVPGSGFGQKDGTFHFRTTILPPEDQMKYLTTELRKFQDQLFARFSGSKI